jgi:adenine-specific DNA methylase
VREEWAVTYYIEHDFPIEQLNPLSRREANAKRAIAKLHKWWARRVGCVFRTMILASLIPEEGNGDEKNRPAEGSRPSPLPCRLPWKKVERCASLSRRACRTTCGEPAEPGIAF